MGCRIGRCTVDRGRNLLSWLIATLIGFPKAGSEQSDPNDADHVAPPPANGRQVSNL
jgi:hypothetical protein